MNSYLDTSLLVAVLSNETATERVQNWLVAQGAGHLIISDWVTTEISSAFAFKLRTGQITPDQRAMAMAAFRKLTASSLLVENMVSRDFSVAADYVARYELGLRASDALHVAVAARIGAAMCTLDRRLASACTALGVPTEDV